jgi:hypothetical protein
MLMMIWLIGIPVMVILFGVFTEVAHPGDGLETDDWFIVAGCVLVWPIAVVTVAPMLLGMGAQRLTRFCLGKPERPD